MKFFNALAIGLPAMASARAVPGPLTPGSIEITDPTRLQALEATRLAAQANARKGNVHPIARNTTSANSKRQFQIAGLAGAVLIETLTTGAIPLTDIAGQLSTALGQDDQDQTWHNHAYCRLYYKTQGGGNCQIKMWNKGSEDSDATHDTGSGCSWNDPDNTDPPVVWYDDAAIGEYSAQWTATNSVAWDGIDGTSKCPAEGLCHPQFQFKRDGYNIVLDEWKSQGEVSACEYSGGEDCKGLCYSGVKDQFGGGGVKWAGDCAVPCVDQGQLPDS